MAPGYHYPTWQELFPPQHGRAALPTLPKGYPLREAPITAPHHPISSVCFDVIAMSSDECHGTQDGNMDPS